LGIGLNHSYYAAKSDRPWWVTNHADDVTVDWRNAPPVQVARKAAVGG
jgi:hypothetical protein